MKYYSEKLDKMFSTEQELCQAEVDAMKAEKEAAAKKAEQEAANKKDAEAKIAEAKAKAAKRAQGAKAIQEAYANANATRKAAYAEARAKANKAYAEADEKTRAAYDEVRKLIDEFNKEFGGYHMTITTGPDADRMVSKIIKDAFIDLDQLFRF